MSEHRGDLNCYAGGCRLAQCRAEKRVYERHQSRIRRRPDSGWNNSKVDAAECRTHLLFLKDYGVSEKDLQQATGLSASALMLIRDGTRKQVFASTADKILVLGTHRFVRSSKALIWHKYWLKKMEERKSEEVQVI